MKQRHYLTVDGLRGVAAMAVMIFHQQRAHIMGRGYLAVDFFFLLSGFVIAKAYERRLVAEMTFLEFAKLRFARLYPLLIIATLVSAAYMAMTSLRTGYGLHELALLPVALLALPDPGMMFAPDPFPLLPVVWSLFFEILANLLYAGLASRLSNMRLVAIITMNALLLTLALAHYGSAEVGNGYATLWAGIPRVCFSFFAGVLWCRLRPGVDSLASSAMSLCLALTLIAVLAAPSATGWVYDAAGIFFVLPALMIAATLVEPGRGLTNPAKVSADMSYPLYLFHLPLMLWIGFLLAHWAVPTGQIQLLQIILIPIAAYFIHRSIDNPMQVRLRAILRGKQKPAIASAFDAG